MKIFTNKRFVTITIDKFLMQVQKSEFQVNLSDTFLYKRNMIIRNLEKISILLREFIEMNHRLILLDYLDKKDVTCSGLLHCR